MHATSTMDTDASSAPVPARGGWNARRVVALLIGLVLGLGSLGLLGAGTTAAAVAGGGYVDLGAHGSYATRGYALTTDPYNWRTGWFGALGTQRFTARSTDGKPLFIGIAKPDAVRRYLDGVEYTTIHKNTGNGNTRTEHSGSAPKTRPANAVDWTAQASGAGTQTIRFDAQQAGEQQLVAMNADGSPAVHGKVVASTVTMPGLAGLGAGLLAGGGVLLAVAVALIAVPIRRVRARRA